MNKADMLMDSMRQVSFKSVCPDFRGSDRDCLDITLYIMKSFMHAYKGREEHKVCPIMTISTDYEIVQHTFDTMEKLLND
ncbi:MAG: hypothetical protein ACK4IX_10765, partial [Candidatus Sericytochromatia bacterium]